MSPGVAQAVYPLWFVLAVVCCTVSGKMLVAAEREGQTSQAWLAAVCFGLWATLAAVSFWGMA
jgi:hypothetical protein